MHRISPYAVSHDIRQTAKRATPEVLTRFHTDEYVHFLTKVTPETAEELTYNGTRCTRPTFQIIITIVLTTLTVLVGEDNPAFEGIFEFCSISAGGTLGLLFVVELFHT